MRLDSSTLDHVARRVVRDSEADLRRFLGVDRLEPELVALIYLHVRGVVERCHEDEAVDELALAIYLTAAAWHSNPEPPVDLITELHGVISRVLKTEPSKGTALKSVLITLVLCLLLTPPAMAEDGAALFKSKCAMCHGIDGSGDTPMGKKLALKPLGSPDVQKLTDDQIGRTIIKGKGKMPSFDGKLAAPQVKVLVAHVRSLKK